MSQTLKNTQQKNTLTKKNHPQKTPHDKTRPQNILVLGIWGAVPHPKSLCELLTLLPGVWGKMTGSLGTSQASSLRAAHDLSCSDLPIPGSCSPKTAQRGKSSWSNDLPPLPGWGRCHYGCWLLLSWQDHGIAQKTVSAGRRAKPTVSLWRAHQHTTESKTTQSLITFF